MGAKMAKLGRYRWLVFLLLLAILIPTRVLAWGPITHAYIAYRTCPIWFDVPSFVRGSVCPDLALWIDRNLHSKLHNPKLAENMLLLARTKSEACFALGWLAHIISDPIESRYSRMKGEATEWKVDKLTMRHLRCGWIVYKYMLRDIPIHLIVEAYSITYPGEFLDPDLVKRGIRNLGRYLFFMIFVQVNRLENYWDAVFPIWHSIVEVHFKVCLKYWDHVRRLSYRME